MHQRARGIKTLAQRGQRLTNGERDFKKGKCLLCESNEVKYPFISDESKRFPVIKLCKVMQVSSSAYYDWTRRPKQTIAEPMLLLYRRMKHLFNESRQSLGSRELMNKLREEGFTIGRYRVRKLMKHLGLRKRSVNPI